MYILCPLTSTTTKALMWFSTALHPARVLNMPLCPSCTLLNHWDTANCNRNCSYCSSHTLMEAYTKPASDSGHTEQDPAALSFYSNLCYGVEIGFVYLQYSATALINIFNGFECSSPFQMWLKSIKELHNFMWN